MTMLCTGTHTFRSTEKIQVLLLEAKRFFCLCRLFSPLAGNIVQFKLSHEQAFIGIFALSIHGNLMLMHLFQIENLNKMMF